MCFGGVVCAIAYLVADKNVLDVIYLSSFGILFISTISVFAFMLPKLWTFKYPKVVPANPNPDPDPDPDPDPNPNPNPNQIVPEAYTMTNGGSMAGHGSSGTKDGSGGGSNNNDDDESEELAEAKRDMSELREQLQELRQSNKELKAEVDAAQRVP